jgi:hypothetical protein
MPCPAMNEATSHALAESKSNENWSPRQFFLLIILAFVAHAALIFIFGTTKSVVPLTAKNVPQLQLADNANELIALENPSLFALPNPKDFASVIWEKIPVVAQPSFRWTETPPWLPLAAENLDATFLKFMQTNLFAGLESDLKPQPHLTEFFSTQSGQTQISQLKIIGGLAQRKLLNEIQLPSLPHNDVIAPSRVQILADATGNVLSAILLPPENPLDAANHYDLADQRALQLARTLQFAPSKNVALGELIFIWQTIPVNPTNSTAQP